MRDITRTIGISKIYVTKVNINGGIVATEDLEQPVQFYGDKIVDEPTALKEVKKVLGDGTYAIRDIQFEERAFKLSVSEFIKIATEVPVVKRVPKPKVAPNIPLDEAVADPNAQ